MSKSSSLPPLTPPPRGRSTPPDASDPDSTPRGDEKGRRLREKNTKRLPASVSAPLLKADESPSRRSSSESVGVIESGGAGASAAVGASAELERARLLHALGVDLLAASLPEAAHGFMQRALRSAPRREAELVAEIMGSLCVTLNQLGRHAEALRMAEAACELLGRRASVQLVAMQHNRSACLEFLGQRALALAATEEGLRLAASLRLGGGDALLGRLRAAQQKLAGQKLAPPHAEGSVPAHQPAKPAAAKGRAGREGPRPAPTAADLGATNAVLAQLLRRLAGTQEQGRGMAEQVEALQAQAAREGERRQREAK